ncbi:MAG: glutamate formimidoyltransferase [Chloroflexi bacterium]|nr:MAG: glutamate formimidoyltransferase [Chloroflexota bacterium]
MAIVECVPNISEGRRPRIVREIARAVERTKGVRLLDYSSDVDHNRSVFTFAGPPAAVARAAIALADASIARIDMRSHQGAHPRIGAVDVIPFVPISGVSMADCVSLAKKVAQALARKHKLPVYLYAKAASRPERVRLPDIRKPQYEGLAALIEGDWKPDFGPSLVHPRAGAIVVGARPPLIAFNMNLRSNDLALARRIAKEIRESSGGMPAVQAMGVQLGDGRAQVSMNLLDYTVTPLSVLWDAVESRARAAGVEVDEGELIGLMPLDAALEVAGSKLRLRQLERTRVIEGHFLE